MSFKALSPILIVALLLPRAFAQAPGGDTSAAAFASIAGSEVAQFREGITVATWMSTRGSREKWESKKPEVDHLYPRQECLNLVKRDLLPDRGIVKRTLYFYPPESRPPYNFPTANSGQLLNTCILGMLRIDAEAPDVGSGSAFDHAAREELKRLYGESVGQGDVPFWGRGFRRDAARWIHGAEIVSGHDPNPHEYYINDKEVVQGSTAYVNARLPFEKSRYEAYPTQNSRYGPIEPAAQFHRAVVLADLNDQLSERFTKFYEQAARASAQAPRSEDKTREESLLAVLREWIVAIKPAPPARRAAGLLAADRYLEATNGRIAGWPADSEKPSDLQDLGVVFQKIPIEFGGGYFYTRNWEKEAHELDALGPAGQMATLGFMARGSCQENGWGSELFRTIIRDGESLLTMRLDASTAAQVHFMVGDAYSDVVAIAGGLVGANGEFSAAPAEGEIDRRKALDHYRAGLAVDKTSERAKSAWIQAWRLTAGLLPGSRYACGGD